MTHNQRAALDFIRAYQADNNGVSPSLQEIATGMGLSSKSGVHLILTQLERQRLIRRDRHRARCIEIVERNPLAGIPTVALLAELEARGVSFPDAPLPRTSGAPPSFAPVSGGGAVTHAEVR